MSYDIKSKKIWPSDFGFTIFTMFLIVGPTIINIAVVIFGNKEISFVAKIILMIVNLVSLFFSVYSLRKCSASDPGIIPVLQK